MDVRKSLPTPAILGTRHFSRWFWSACLFISTLCSIGILNETVASADPLDNWTHKFQTPLTSNSPYYPNYPIDLFDVAFGNGMFVAVGHYHGDYGTIYSSPDGVNWTLRSQPPYTPTTPTYGELRTVLFTNGMFIAGGWGGYIYTSTNAVDWAGTHVGIGAASGVNDICYGNGLYVAVRGSVGTTLYDSNIVTSVDGLNWTARRGARLHYSDLSHVAFGTNLFVAVESSGGQTNHFRVSSNGTQWWNLPFSTKQDLNGLAYGNGVFVAVGRRGYPGVILTGTKSRTYFPPPDLEFTIDWTERPYGATNALHHVEYVNGHFIVSGDSIFLTSTNGINWQSRPVPINVSRFTLANGTLVGISGWTNVYQSDLLVSLAAPSAIPGNLELVGVPGLKYRIEHTDDLLTDTQWQTSPTFLMTASPFVWTDTSSNIPPTRFYRAVWAP